MTREKHIVGAANLANAFEITSYDGGLLRCVFVKGKHCDRGEEALYFEPFAFRILAFCDPSEQLVNRDNRDDAVCGGS